jgi:hypothetical protein
VTPGVYRHYKGHDYRVLTVARHSETGEALVIYIPLHAAEGESITPWARPLAMFAEDVVVEGKNVPRFRLMMAMGQAAPYCGTESDADAT